MLWQPIRCWGCNASSSSHSNVIGQGECKDLLASMTNLSWLLDDIIMLFIWRIIGQFIRCWTLPKTKSWLYFCSVNSFSLLVPYFDTLVDYSVSLRSFGPLWHTWRSQQSESLMKIGCSFSVSCCVLEQDTSPWQGRQNHAWQQLPLEWKSVWMSEWEAIVEYFEIPWWCQKRYIREIYFIFIVFLTSARGETLGVNKIRRFSRCQNTLKKKSFYQSSCLTTTPTHSALAHTDVNKY